MKNAWDQRNSGHWQEKNSIQKPAAKISESITDTELPENPLVQEILSRTEPETLEELASLVLGKSLFLQMTEERSVRNMTLA